MKQRAIRLTVLITLSLVALPWSLAQQQRTGKYAQTKLDAERSHAEGSYAIAHRHYAALAAADIPDSEKRWVAFRLADTEWRADAATERSDDTIAQRARVALDALIAQPDAPHDLVWAEVNESLGDWHFKRRGRADWSGADSYYRAALEWWSASRDLETARRRYLDIIWKVTEAGDRPYYYGYRGYQLPLDLARNAARIAESPEDKTRANLILARALVYQANTPEEHEESLRAWEAATSSSKAVHDADTALFEYAMWAEQRGTIEEIAANQWQVRPDYELAARLYERLLATWSEGQSKHWREAKQRLSTIVEPNLSVATNSAFLPGEEPHFMLSSRNIPSVQFSLYRVSLTDELSLTDPNAANRPPDFLYSRRDRVRQWTHTIDGASDRHPRAEKIAIEQKLEAGTYLIEATSGPKRSSELLFVTDVVIVTKSSGSSLVTFITDAVTGAPRPNAEVRVASWKKDKTKIYEESKRSDADGLARFTVASGNGSYQTAVIARSGRSESLSSLHSYYHYNGDRDTWVIYALTDRPAYRPEEKVEWKFTARRRRGGAYETPADQNLLYDIRDPRGNVVKEGSVKLNRFGSAWGTLPLDATMPLGMYQVNFKDSAQRGIASTQLFRLEEYKLPEFTVSVELPKEKGQPKIFRTGDTVTATIKAEYYFGGAVPNAEVQVTVQERQFSPYWHAPRDFAWFYDDRQNHYYGRGGSVIKSETVRTGPDGTAAITFPTPRSGQPNLEYEITARVTDSSRRQVEGSGSVRVSQQGYFVYANVDHYIYTPGERARVSFKALDANGQPIRVKGEVVVTREEWVEVWIDTDRRKIRGADVSRTRRELGEPAFSKRYTFLSGGYERENITTQSLETDSKGEAIFEMTIPKEGFYRFTWSSPDQRKGSRFTSPVTATTAVWVARDATNFIGYRHEGVEIIIDKESVWSGEVAPVMIVSRDPGAFVFFTVEAETLLDTRVVKLDGNVKLVQLPIDARHIPNVFLSALSVRDGNLLGDSKQLIVPPREQFIDVAVTSSRSELQPGEEGAFTVTTRDWQGKPIASEVTLAVRDASVFAIQNDLAIDPRQFFYGQKRGNHVQTGSSLHHRGFQSLQEARANKQRGDREEGDRLSDGRDMAAQYNKAEGGVAGGIAIGAVAESITVTSNAPLMDAAMAPAAPPPPPAVVAPAPQGSGVAIKVRTDFRSTIVWRPDLATDDSGTASVKVQYPDSTTTWNASATAFSPATEVGASSATVRTRKPLIARLQLPRFLVVGDTVTISGVLNNNTSGALTVEPTLALSGVQLASPAHAADVTIGAGGDERINWQVRATEAGVAKFTLTARGSESDAMELSIPVVEHGIDKLIAASGKMRDGSVNISLTLPARRPESTRMTVQVTPSIAVTMLDALPYLIEFPYGCTEQTMSRFLPAVIVANTLRDVGVSPATVERKLFGGVEPSTADKTHRGVTRTNIRKLDDVAEGGLMRLYDFQHADGGWGWWKEGESDIYMSAYVVWGMTLAKDGGITIRDASLRRGVEFLEKRIVELEDLPANQAWVLHALAEYRYLTKSTPSAAEVKALDNVWNARTKLQPYPRALLAIAAERIGQHDRAMTLLRNFENDVVTDDAPDASVVIRSAGRGDSSVVATAHWGEEYGWWRWHDGAVESTAMVLRAFVTIDPKHRLVEPAMNWLVKNRRGAQWNNTKDTALAVLSLNEYMKQTKELGGNVSYEVSVNGTVIATKNITTAEMIEAPSLFAVDASLVRDQNEITIRRTGGSAPLYFAAQATFFSLEEPVKAAGNEIFVKREFYRIVSRPTLLSGFIEERELLRDGDTVKSGDRIEVEATVEVKNNYEYLMFEDLKAAGFEAVAVRSGEPMYAQKLKRTGIEKVNTQRGEEREQRDVQATQWLYQELRDRKVVMFADRLSQGIWRFKYTLRAQTPGRFHALPMIGSAMYVPELKGNSDEVRLSVED